jgi:hypothetical protein
LQDQWLLRKTELAKPSKIAVRVSEGFISEMHGFSEPAGDAQFLRLLQTRTCSLHRNDGRSTWARHQFSSRLRLKLPGVFHKRGHAATPSRSIDAAVDDGNIGQSLFERTRHRDDRRVSGGASLHAQS